MSETMEFDTVSPASQPEALAAIRQLLADCQLELDSKIDVFVVVYRQGSLIACAGLSGNIIKCVAIAPQWRGESLSLQLVNEVVQIAAERGHFHLFLYTKPENQRFFTGCGFYTLVEVPGHVVLMENTPVGIQHYCQRLRMLRQPSNKTGCIVMNANPFTLGHRYLAEQAAAACDWLHVFVVREDVSFFPYAQRYELVTQGLGGIPNLTVHHGSEYMISRATFPSYFLKDKGIVDSCHTAIDLLLFRDYIAPALGISHRFIGTEPFCPVTNKYNEDMKQWLQHAHCPAPAIEVVELSRHVRNGQPVSASRVRRLLSRQDFNAIQALVPPSTLQLLLSEYAAEPAPALERYG
ncbi:MAG: [citrate (pro-3S)-lyase] ligase [Aquitalea sp.]|nr:[citrate (pro-3S)-lyase] ligase [Aquitalea sp.]